MTDWKLAAALEGSPYSIDAAGADAVLAEVARIESSVEALRASGTLTEDTLRRYYGRKRFEQVAESNAIEGSTLSVGETEVAILSGTTLTGHDPGYVRDARSLDRALTRLAELARGREATNIAQLKELHALILEGQQSPGMFRSEPVRISGSEHRPPKTWHEVMSAMEEWERWSLAHANLPAPLRAIVLHTWLTHIHPFRDGNGRSARAIMNLELVRAGYPPAIIRKTQERVRYIAALRQSDDAGDIGPITELILDRVRAALVGLEGAAREVEGYDQQVALLRRAQARRLDVWNQSVELFHRVLLDKLASRVEQAGGEVRTQVISDSLGLDEYAALCEGRFGGSNSWAFRIRVSFPGLTPVERLAWIGFRSRELRIAAQAPQVFTPAIYWSKRTGVSYPPWEASRSDAPGLRELSVTPSEGDKWHALKPGGQYVSLTTIEAADIVAKGFIDLLAHDDGT